MGHWDRLYRLFYSIWFQDRSFWLIAVHLSLVALFNSNTDSLRTKVFFRKSAVHPDMRFEFWSGPRTNLSVLSFYWSRDRLRFPRDRMLGYIQYQTENSYVLECRWSTVKVKLSIYKYKLARKCFPLFDRSRWKSLVFLECISPTENRHGMIEATYKWNINILKSVNNHF